jgi:uncharacterized repeat protein (TIGR02543 family)
MSWRAGVVCALLLQMALVVGGGAATARAAAAAAPPTLKIEVIGAGRVTGLGIICGLANLACYSSYGTDHEAVTLTATAAPGWTFSGWEDGVLGCGNTNPCAVAGGVTGNMTATAVFTTTSVVKTSTFGVSLASPANGTVTNGPSSNYPIDCPTTPAGCTLTAVQGSTLTVVEQPGAGFFFAGWGGSCAGEGVSCAVYLNADKFVDANFVSTAPNSLTVTVSGSGNVSGGGISCGTGSTCDEQEPPNEPVTLTATPQGGWAFVGWTGDCTGTTPTCTVQMDTARNVTATFEQLVPLAVTVSGNGTVSGPSVSCGPGPTTCTAGQAPGSTVTLTATPGTSGGSVSWSGCSSTAGSLCSVTMGTTAQSVTATFAGGVAPPTSTNALNITVRGSGYVISTTSDASFHCTAAGGSGCSANVQANTSLTLSAVPASGSVANFLHWQGACSSFTSTSCTLTMDGPKSVEADFAGGNQTYALSGQVNGNGTISGAGLTCTLAGGAACNVPQAAGATVTITATPDAGASFTGWAGACSGTNPVCTVAMTVQKSVTATFTTAGGGGGTTGSLLVVVRGAGQVSAPRGVCASTDGKSQACPQQYNGGQSVTLTEKPAAGFVFGGWTGSCSGKKTTCTLKIGTSETVVVSFARAVIAPTRAPKVVKAGTGYRVTLSFSAGEPGTIKLVTKKGSRTVGSTSAKVAAGSRQVKVEVPAAGRYTFTLTLASGSGRHSIRWSVTT